MRDRFLDEITPLLREIVEKQVPDVRRALRAYRDQVLRQVSNGAANPSIVFNWPMSYEVKIIVNSKGFLSTHAQIHKKEVIQTHAKAN